MTELTSLLGALRRPRLLIRAARFGLAEYRRTPALRRLFAAAGAHTPAQVIALLLAREAEPEARRKSGDAGYSVARHVELLIALMAEARLLPQDTAPAPARRGAPRQTATRRDQPKASGISSLRRATKSASAACTAGSSVGAS